jgi:cell division protein FtsB
VAAVPEGPRRGKSARAKTAPKGKPNAPARETTKEPRPGRMPSMRAALFLVVLVGLLFAFVYPTRTFLDQRAATGKAQAQLELLQSENARMARETKKLRTDSEIEKLAREKYGLVKPGERAFVILPAPTSTTLPPSASTTQAAP